VNARILIAIVGPVFLLGFFVIPFLVDCFKLLFIKKYREQRKQQRAFRKQQKIKNTN
jgi:hypothetical protein